MQCPTSLVYLSGETVDQILLIIYQSIVHDLTTCWALWNLSPRETYGTLRVLFQEFFHLRLVCKELNHRIIYFAALWTIFPLGQMDQDDVRRSLERSKGSHITVLLSDSRSRSNFDIIIQQAKHANRIRRLYIDMPATKWPGLSMIMQLHQFPALETLFISSRGIHDEYQTDGHGVNIPAWGALPVTTHSTPIATRRRSQLSYKVAIARLAHVPATVLCIRDSAFAWQYFTPPFQLTTLQVHNGHHAGDVPIPLSLPEFDTAIRSIPTLQELLLWNVNAHGPRALPALTGSNIRHIALRGPHGSIASITHYLRQCNANIFVVQITDAYGSSKEIVDADIQSSVDAFRIGRTISTVGIFANIPDHTSYGTTVDLVLTSADGATMSLQVPIFHWYTLQHISTTSTTPNTRLSFDMTVGEYTSEALQVLIQEDLHMGAFHSYHLCIQDQHVDDILTALDQHRPREPRTLVWLHGEDRYSAWNRVSSTRPQWTPYLDVARQSKCSTLEPREGAGWTDERGTTLFSPSVPKPHHHMMRMSKYDERVSRFRNRTKYNSPTPIPKST